MSHFLSVMGLGVKSIHGDGPGAFESVAEFQFEAMDSAQHSIGRDEQSKEGVPPMPWTLPL